MHISNLSLLLNYLEMNYYAFGNVQCMLYFVFCILYFVFYILYLIFDILYFTFYILYSVLHILHFTFYIFITSKSYCMLHRRTLYTPVVEVYVEVFIIYSNL